MTARHGRFAVGFCMTLPLTPADAVRIGLRHGASRMRVFGSFARGTARPDSDLDLVVDLDPAARSSTSSG